MKSERNRVLWELTRGHRLRYGAAMLAMWLAIVAQFSVPLVSMLAIDALVEGGGGGAGASPPWLRPLAERLATLGPEARILGFSALVLVALTALAGLLHYLRGRWAAQASEAIARELRERLYEHLHRLPLAFHDRAETGDLVQRSTSDVETLRTFLAAQVVELGRAALLILSVTPLLFLLEVRMALVSLALYPLIVIFAGAFFRRIKADFKRSDEAEARMTAVLQENLTGIRVVRAFGRESHECAKFARENAGHRDALLRLIRLLGVYWSSSDLTCMLQVGLVLIGGGWWLGQGEISVGTFFAFLTLQGIVIWPVRHMGRVLSETGKAVVALGRLREILEEPQEAAGVQEAETQGVRLQGEIRFSAVHFAYGADEPVLRDLSFHVKSGESVALLGPPGSGKSTVVQLILRLYEHQHGSIRLDDREIGELDRETLRAQIGVVLQEPFLYSKSILDNLELGRPDCALDELVACTRDAAVHEAIQSMPEGYYTLLGERGLTLSGGQRQRVAIARALLKDAPILLLDDALSAVDTRTEATILEALRTRRGRSTTLLVTHRLSAIPLVDRILVFEGGRIVQDGTHRELLEEPGPYRRLWQIQDALEESLRDELAEITA